MFEKFTKLHVLRPRHPVRGAAPANDNSRGALRPGVGRARRPPLVCRWSSEQGQGLTCHWEMDSTGAPNPLPDDKPRPDSRSEPQQESRSDSWRASRPDNSIHKSVFGPSYTAHKRGTPSASPLLQARH